MVLGIFILVIVIIFLFVPPNKNDRTLNNLISSFIVLLTLSSNFLIYNCVYAESWHVLYLFLVRATYFRFNYKNLKSFVERHRFKINLRKVYT